MIRDFENTWPVRRVDPDDLAQRARERQGDDVPQSDDDTRGSMAMLAYAIVYVAVAVILAVLLAHLWGRM